MGDEGVDTPVTALSRLKHMDICLWHQSTLGIEDSVGHYIFGIFDWQFDRPLPGVTPAMKLTVYVPAPDSELRDHIKAGSGIVGSPYGDTGRLRIDFEGNLYQLPELKDYADRVKRAAERHLWRGENGERYPTSACAYVSPEEVVEIGSWDPEGGKLEITDQGMVRSWLSPDSKER